VDDEEPRIVTEKEGSLKSIEDMKSVESEKEDDDYEF
jgi:hypothetical protein